MRRERALPIPALLAVGAAVAVGAMLRILAGQGALWLDEAWSAIFAHESQTMIGAIRIRHDNNHLLNTWWLQLVGWDAPPVVARGLSILSGTLTIPIAATIAARRGATAAVLAAWMFATSPVLVTYGSEARGYAPMLLGLTVAILLLGRELDGRGGVRPSTRLAVALGLAALAHLTIVFAMPALFGWAMWAKRRDRPIPRALCLLGPSVVAVAISVVITVGGGLAMGSYQPFAMAAWADALGQLLQYTLGAVWVPAHILLVAATIATAIGCYWNRDDHWAVLVVLAVMAFPLGVAALSIGNSGFSRYYLIATVPMLLALSQAKRGFAIPIAIGVVVVSLATDIAQIDNQRADPAAAISAMRTAVPGGAIYCVENSRDMAVIEVAAAEAGYPVRQGEDCNRAQFLFVSRDRRAAFDDNIIQGYGAEPVAGADATGLTAYHWRLYRRAEP